MYLFYRISLLFNFESAFEIQAKTVKAVNRVVIRLNVSTLLVHFLFLGTPPFILAIFSEADGNCLPPVHILFISNKADMFSGTYCTGLLRPKHIRFVMGVCGTK